MKELTLTDELTGVPESKAKQIKEVFEPMVKMLESFEGAYTEVMALEQSEEKSKRAKRLRLDIAKIRVKADKVRAAEKEEYVRAGKAIQGVYNVLKYAVTDKEEKLKEIETYYERIEAEKIAKIQAQRETELLKFDADSTGLDLGNMKDELWDNYIAGAKANYENLKAAERKSEEERIERERKESIYDQRLKSLLIYGDLFDTSRLTIESSEEDFEKIIFDTKALKVEKDRQQEEIRKENARLKAESEKKEAERKKAEEKDRKEREARENELAKERAERQRIEKEQRDREERQRLESEEKAKAEAEAKRKAELSPDKDKLVKYSTELLSQLNSVKSKEAKQAIQEAAFVLSSAAEGM